MYMPTFPCFFSLFWDPSLALSLTTTLPRWLFNTYRWLKPLCLSLEVFFSFTLTTLVYKAERLCSRNNLQILSKTSNCVLKIMRGIFIDHIPRWHTFWFFFLNNKLNSENLELDILEENLGMQLYQPRHTYRGKIMGCLLLEIFKSFWAVSFTSLLILCTRWCLTTYLTVKHIYFS